MVKKCHSYNKNKCKSMKQKQEVIGSLWINQGIITFSVLSMFLPHGYRQLRCKHQPF